MRIGGPAEPAHYNESEIGMSDTKEQAETTAQSKAWDPFQLMDRMDEEALRRELEGVAAPTWSMWCEREARKSLGSPRPA